MSQTLSETTLAEVERALPRMQRLGTRFVRIMSYRPDDDADRIPPEVVRRVREVTARFRDGGCQVVHENCMNFGGMSGHHAVELLEAVPDLQWVFDTANPVFNPDRSRPKPWTRQARRGLPDACLFGRTSKLNSGDFCWLIWLGYTPVGIAGAKPGNPSVTGTKAQALGLLKFQATANSGSSSVTEGLRRLFNFFSWVF